jgi:hypothetical protein
MLAPLSLGEGLGERTYSSFVLKTRGEKASLSPTSPQPSPKERESLHSSLKVARAVVYV